MADNVTRHRYIGTGRSGPDCPRPGSRSPHPWLLNAARRLYSGWRHRNEIAEIDRLDDRELADAGLKRSDVPVIAASTWPDRDLLLEMLRRLGLQGHPWVQEISYRRSLERTCATCCVRRRCASWLSDGGRRPEPYQTFCRNADELGMMIQTRIDMPGAADEHL